MIDIDVDMITFKDLFYGDVFLYNNIIYMKALNNTPTDEFNCVNLSEACFDFCANSSHVIPLEAHLQCSFILAGTTPRVKPTRKLCDCYDKDSNRCNGTKERDYCNCRGDTYKCDFYPDVKKNGRG